jgi:hypothetical protein
VREAEVQQCVLPLVCRVRHTSAVLVREWSTCMLKVVGGR